ncbi:CsbD family protein [Frankia sp. AgPm24]|uniref:CsbD family protein n=1 Tax=Frankia umida TaxID=573489 RepID=A0ABT0JW14_9ACTN|nr:MULTISPECIES: CsbD family protein [Frankia]MCK9875747.1 CsbD family protein [Frankia umida]MCK9924044.1 CsbD family protein [Frankia sp. AgPm24]
MSFTDKIRNKVDELRGRGKQATGRAAGDRRTESEGRGERASADLRQAGEKAKDAFRH